MRRRIRKVNVAPARDRIEDIHSSYLVVGARECNDLHDLWMFDELGVKVSLLRPCDLEH